MVTVSHLAPFCHLGLNCFYILIGPSWSSWGPYSVCSVTCGSGIRSRRRTCSPAGADCTGSARMTEQCNMPTCTSKSVTMKEPCNMPTCTSKSVTMKEPCNMPHVQVSQSQ